ncbi:MAG: alpha-L-fucosidase [Bacteroidales bacterium]|nr:alpha-L-fucosidase [Bacteroidales bacterium]
MKSFRPIALAIAVLLMAACTAPAPFGPVPTDAQLAWQRMEINMFCHFGPNTFTGAEWGSGQEAEEVFAPKALDCSQWVDVAKQAGMGGIILTAKHHDGFCLWPSAYSTHTVTTDNDVLRQFVDACRGKVKAGVYISPWDRNHPTYGTDAYNDVFVNTLNEVHTHYGPFFEQWFDGACGEGPNGKKQHYDWPRFMLVMHELNPQAVIFSDIGPGCRWVGNEQGHCGDPCWSTLNTEGATPSDNKPQPSELETGHQNGTHWVPAEVDVSIRPGWFWHANEHPKTVDELMEIYYNSVGRNGLLLLNVPPDTNGRISAEDSATLVAFRAERDRIFSKDLAQGAKVRAMGRLGHKAANVLDTAYHTYWAATGKNAELTLYLDTVTEFNIIVIQEYIPLGQRIENVQLAIDEGDGVYPHSTLCTTVGYKRIIRLDSPTRTDRLVFTFHAAIPPVINRIALYNSKAQ